MVVALWLVLLMRVVDRGSVDGRLAAVLGAGLSGRAVGGTGEQRHEADRDDRTDLSGPPAQLGETAKPRVPRGVPGMAGPGRVTGVGIEVGPALAPGGRHPCGMGRLARNRVRGLARNGISRLVGKDGMALVGVEGRPIVRAALHGAAARLIAAGVVRVSVLCWPVSRAGPGRAGEFRCPRGVLARAAAGPAGGRALRARPGIGRKIGGVLTLAGACPIRAASLPGPVVC